MRWYSSRVRPCRSRTSSVDGHRAAAALENAPSLTDFTTETRSDQAVGAADSQLAGALGMRHQSDDVAVLAAESGDVVDRSVRVGLRGDSAFGRRIAEDDLTILLEPLDDVGLGVVVPFAVRDWNPQQLSRTTGRRERRVRLFHLDDDVLALELHAAVAEHRTRQQTRFEQHLEAVADAEDGAAGVGKAFHLGHDR